MKTNSLSDNTHTATGSQNDPTEGFDKGPNPEFQEAYGVGQGQAGKSLFSGKVLCTAIWAFFSLVIEACIVVSILWETMEAFCPDSNPLQEYWEINDNLMKDLIRDNAETGYDETDYDDIPPFHLHKPEDVSISFPKSASRVLAMWILGMSLGKEAMDILTVFPHSFSRLKVDMISKHYITNRRTRNHVGREEDARSAFNVVVVAYFVMGTACLRFLCCWLVCVMSFVIVKNSETILDIWKDCVAIAFIVEIDSLLFSAMKKGMITGAMMDCTKNFPGKVCINAKESPRLFLRNGGYVVSFFCIILMCLMVAREVNTKLFEESITKTGAYALFGSTDCDILYVENDWNQTDFLINATAFVDDVPGGR